MSQSIWTQCEGEFKARALASQPWRVVEAQHINATRKLVDSDDEQEILERLIDTAKSPWPRGMKGLHYLLATPFRHPPLPNGSRFGTRQERGIFYGSEARSTALAEKAYYQLLFLEGTRAELAPITQALTLFRSKIRAKKGVDLRKPPFDRFEKKISSPTNYRYSQTLGRELREHGVEAFRFVSARDPECAPTSRSLNRVCAKDTHERRKLDRDHRNNARGVQAHREQP